MPSTRVPFATALLLGSTIFLPPGASGAGRLQQQEAPEAETRTYADVIRTIADLGGSYADVKHSIDEAKSREYLTSRVVVDALPKPGRRYYRESEDDDGFVTYERYICCDMGWEKE